MTSSWGRLPRARALASLRCQPSIRAFGRPIPDRLLASAQGPSWCVPVLQEVVLVFNRLTSSSQEGTVSFETGLGHSTPGP